MVLYMEPKKHLLYIIFILLAATPAFAQQNLVKTDPNSSYINIGIEEQEIYGTIAGIDTYIILDPENLDKSEIQGSATVKTINTGNIIRDKKLLSKNNLNESEFPYISFQSTNIEKLEENVYMVTGDLTIRDITEKIYVEMYFQIDRILGVSYFNTIDFDLDIKGEKNNKVDLYLELFFPGAE